MADEGKERCRIAVLVASPDGQRILVRDDAALGGPTLPTGTVPISDEPAMERTIEVAAEVVGHPIVPLRLVLRAFDAERRPTLAVVETAPMEVEADAGTRWMSRERLRGSLQPADLRAMLTWWLDRDRDASTGSPPSPWTRPGWFERASSWMVDRMTRAGHPPDGPTRMVYLWPLSVVLRTSSPAGNAYLKSAAPVFAHEAAITALLASRTPDAVPEVLDLDPNDNWLLMRDLGGSVVGDEPPAAWGDGLVRLAALQRSWADGGAELERAGAQRRTLDSLSEDVPGFCDRLHLGDRLDWESRRAWSASMPRLVAACSRLRDAGVPDTLVHGDFHPWNVARTPRGLVVFDWSDGAIGHPFVDMVTTLARTPDIEVRRGLADRYLEAWPEIAARDRPGVADLAMVVGSLYQVQSYLAILATLDPEDSLDLQGADVRWARRALGALEQGIAVPRPS